MTCYQMARKKKDDTEQTEQFLLRPRTALLERLTTAAENAKRFVTRNQVALEILERYLPFWEEVERRNEANVEAQYARLNVYVPEDSTAPKGRAIPGIDGALESELDEVCDVRPATKEEIEQAHGAKGGARKGRR